MEIKDIILKHFQNNYYVIVGHPSNENGASPNLIFNRVISKVDYNDELERDSFSFARRIISEINDEDLNDLLLQDDASAYYLVLDVRNEYVRSLVYRKRGYVIL